MLDKALEKAEELAGRTMFEEAIRALEPFKSSPVMKIAADAGEHGADISRRAAEFRKKCEKEVSRARALLEKRDFEGAQEALAPFQSTDIAEICAAVREVSDEISRRRDAPQGTVLISGGNLPSEGGQTPVAPFYMMQNEVSNGQFERFLRENPGASSPHGWINGKPPAGDENLPVTGVSRSEALAFAAWLGTRESRTYRLPTEAEWQWAAGAGRSKYPWGDGDEPLASLAIANGAEKPVAVNDPTADRSPFGVLNMAGNVSEWTVAAGGDGSVVKGGSFADPDRRGAAVAFRIPWNHPGGKLPSIGFRLVAELKK
jgi:hypothetical protein